MRFARCALANPPLEKVEPNIHFFHEVMKRWSKIPVYTFAHLKRRLYISQHGIAVLLNITKAVYQWQSNSCQSTFKDAEPYGSAFRMCNGVKNI
jgi:hypothetical protein